ncbi:galactose mutarotase [Bacteroides thetaiotaomicron]|jgi:aldose 1-epimerase|uniref:aldose epimerase family protein n=1 Tax=Bacteroides thetaiotaomicron TaxID=818 RepID=UPI001C02338A|nr:aldose epimerase family protein [Bacteroides thetaiotaomicron]MBT9888299.1 galactose-1-epimerase [Bacteroides thetaiotaomicron]MCA5976706.1 galactose mutarotase [Bacteroides thetaiotaomicron]MCE8480189.1 galactose mutarotase [Bacteroides thetaiotaomicron]MCS3040336.1 galactose mutarotase [Bacteroides thetaiotaomicron]UVV86253.1 galactose mutarotase [Bacteroides thetaiotaomicron]
MKKLCVWAVAALLMAACTPKAEKTTDSGLLQSNFQMEVDGKKTDLYTLRNKNNMEVCVTNFGGRIVSVMVPDKDGQMRDVVLGFDSIQDYVSKPSDFGASIGRYANRINQGRFTLDGTEYQLPQNNYGHCLHGGPQGFQYRVFDAVQPNPQELELTYMAEDGEEGFPGNITCKVLMKLTDDNAIDIRYEAETDKPTIVNMTNHSYFNLDGDAARNEAHLLTIDADYYTPVDSTFMTTGEIAPVEGTPMDFRTPTPVGARINDYDFVQLKNGNGYDHNWVLNTKGDITRKCATLESPLTGIVLDVYTNEPGIQVYAGNFLDGSLTGKKGITYNQRASVCLETQKYPDTPNKPEWPSAVLRPGEKYMSQCIFKFSVDKN